MKVAVWIIAVCLLCIVLSGGLTFRVSHVVADGNANNTETKQEEKSARDLFRAENMEYVRFDGHDYVLYELGNRGGITHSPKCDCLNRKQEEE